MATTESSPSPKRSRREENDHRGRGSRKSEEQNDDRRMERRGRDMDREDTGHRDRSRDDRRRENVERSREDERKTERSPRKRKDYDRGDERKENDDSELKESPKRKVFKNMEQREEMQIDEHFGTQVSSDKPKAVSIALMEEAQAALEAKEQAKEKASFEYSGKLAAETNKANGVALLFTEPHEARKPTVRWRLYVFKDEKPLDEPLLIHRQSCYLFGRERKIADIPIDHPSCSKQHAVIQYRLVEKEVDGLTSKKIRPYLMDLGSTNKTFLNGKALEPQRYYELFEKDAIKFGNSSREYILLHENSA